jgi:hypothetical protein
MRRRGEGRRLGAVRALWLAALVLLGAEALATVVLVVRHWSMPRPGYAILERFALSAPVGLALRPPARRHYEAVFGPGLDLAGMTQRDLGDVGEPRQSLIRKVITADVVLGWRPGRNVIASEDYAFLHLTNDQGFVSLGTARFHYAIPKPPGVYRIVMLGGSTVYGRGVRAPQQSLPAHLARRLGNVEVINAGVMGYASGQELLYLSTELLDYRPDLVIAYDGANERFAMGARSERHDHLEARLAATYTLSGSFGIAGLVALATTHETLSRLALYHAAWSLARRAVRDAPPHAVGELPLPRVLELYGRHVVTMARVTEEAGARFAWALQPVLGPDGKSMSATERTNFDGLGSAEVTRRNAFYAGARALVADVRARAPGACVMDLSELFRGVATPIYFSTTHLNEEGNARVADAIVAGLRECGLPVVGRKS